MHKYHLSNNKALHVTLKRLTWFNEMRDVSDVDADLQIAIFQRPAVQRVVYVRTAGRIHAADVQMTQVFAI